MRLILLGPPGAGKGTQATAICDRFGVPHISTGDILRDAIGAETPVGVRAKEIVASGRLVPDEMAGELVAERLSREDARKGFLLDGFPRTIRQAQILETILKARREPLRAVVKLALPDEDVVRRLSGRRTCVRCGMPHHVESATPGAVGACVSCGGELRQREDDQEDVIRNRLRVYHEQTAPLAAWYAERGLLEEIDGRGTMDEVRRRLESALEQR